MVALFTRQQQSFKFESQIQIFGPSASASKSPLFRNNFVHVTNIVQYPVCVIEFVMSVNNNSGLSSLHFVAQHHVQVKSVRR